MLTVEVQTVAEAEALEDFVVQDLKVCAACSEDLSHHEVGGQKLPPHVERGHHHHSMAK